MKVKALIRYLSQFDPETEVVRESTWEGRTSVLTKFDLINVSDNVFLLRALGGVSDNTLHNNMTALEYAQKINAESNTKS